MCLNNAPIGGSVEPSKECKAKFTVTRAFRLVVLFVAFLVIKCITCALGVLNLSVNCTKKEKRKKSALNLNL